MTLVYSPDRPVSQSDLLALYGSVGWSSYTRDPAGLHRAVAGSLWRMGAWDGPELIGLVRAVGDDASIARLLAAALERFAHVRQLVLVADDEEKTASFYRSAGLTDLADEGCRAFVRFPPAGGAACVP